MSEFRIAARSGTDVAERADVVDRRRAARYRFGTALPAAVSFVQDAVLESFDGQRARLVSSQAAAPGDELVMLFRAPDGAPIRCVMRVRSSTPLMHDHAVSYRLELHAVGAPGRPDLALFAHL